MSGERERERDFQKTARSPSLLYMGESTGIDNTNFEKKFFCDQIDMGPSFGDAWAG